MVTAAQPLPLPRTARLRHLGPNWYASVMGTAIVGSAGAALARRTGRALSSRASGRCPCSC